MSNRMHGGGDISSPTWVSRLECGLINDADLAHDLAAQLCKRLYGGLVGRSYSFNSHDLTLSRPTHYRDAISHVLYPGNRVALLAGYHHLCYRAHGPRLVGQGVGNLFTVVRMFDVLAEGRQAIACPELYNNTSLLASLTALGFAPLTDLAAVEPEVAAARQSG